MRLKGRDVGVAVPPGGRKREPCRKAWLLLIFQQAEKPAGGLICQADHPTVREARRQNFPTPALKGLRKAFRSGYNNIHEKSSSARNAFRPPSIRRQRIVVRQGRPVGFRAGGAKEDVAAITVTPTTENPRQGPCGPVFFVGGGRDGRPGRLRCVNLPGSTGLRKLRRGGLFPGETTVPAANLPGILAEVLIFPVIDKNLTVF
jgi:hypothetical protein